MKPLLFTFAILLAAVVHGQEQNYSISQPLDLGENGWSKVLCMKNGNTMLFHFRPGKRIKVVVFDASHKLIASRRQPSRELDAFMIEFVSFKGLFEINGEAVLFIDQDQRGKHKLIMLRYSATDGEMVDEKLVAESRSEDKRLQYYVVKNKHEDNYEILFCMDKRHPKASDIFVVYFNNKHEQVKEVQLDVDRAKYDYLQVLGAEWQPSGLLVTIGLDKTISYGGAVDLNRALFAPADHDSALRVGNSVFEHYVQYFYLPSDSSGMRRGLVDLAQGFFPYFTLYTYNPAAEKLNMLLYSFKPLYYQFGISELLGSVSDDLLFSIDRHDMKARLNMLEGDVFALSVGKDSSSHFQGMPLKMFTNNDGVSTVVSQAYIRYGEPETADRYNYQDYFNGIGITQFDDSGNELWSTVLPLAQYYKSYRGYLDERQLARRWQDQVIFGDQPEQVHNRQLISCNTYSKDGNFYVICNDYNKNIDRGAKKRVDTVYSFENTNACYYKIDGKKEVTKNYLFGAPQRGENRSSFIEGADFDEERGIYATLIQSTRNNNVTLRMAWRTLD